MSQPLYLAIDIGTGSVRAGLFTSSGRKLGYGEHPIHTRHLQPLHYEQSTDDIWRAVISSVRSAIIVLQAPYHPSHVRGIGVDATCSLVAVLADDDDLTPLPVTPSTAHDPVSHNDVYNVLLWLDRRAIPHARRLNNISDSAVHQVRVHHGGTLSPENQPPKLMWLKEHHPELLSQAAFYDLADWLVAKLTNTRHTRSRCTVSTKWGWGADDKSVWNPDFWQALGVPDVVENDFAKIGTDIIAPGASVGTVASPIARLLGVPVDTVVAASLVDAYAGAVWSIGADVHTALGQHPDYPRLQPADLGVCSRLSMVCGTSTCHLAMSESAIFVPGVWGPFASAIVPGLHVTEGGQTVTGKLLQHVVETHPAYRELCARVGMKSVYDTLAEMTERVLSDGEQDPTTDVHVLDYHAGNRSPIADSSLTGVVVGCTLETDEWGLAVLFRATVQAVCYGARHVVEEMKTAGMAMNVVMMCGGLCRSDLFMREMADCLGLPVVLSDEEDTVLLGDAVVARAAHTMSEGVTDGDDVAKRLTDVAREMCRVGSVFMPNQERKSFHDRKYRVYRRMHADMMDYRRIMSDQDSATD